MSEVVQEYLTGERKGLAGAADEPRSRNLPDRTQEISVYRIAQTSVNGLAVDNWLDALGVEEFDYPDFSVPDPEYLISLAGKRCYKSFQAGLNPNVSRVRSDYAEYLENILKVGHGSVLEHATFTYAIEGVSRVFTAEMNRHRAGWAISEGSLRFIRFDEINYWLPESLRDKADDDAGTSHRKAETRRIFAEAFKQDEDNYKKLVALWDVDGATSFKYKKEVTSCFRRIVGMGVATGGVWTGNVRGMRHVLTMRCAPEAEEEIRAVFVIIAEDLIENHPMLFGDFKRDEAGYFRPKYAKV